MLGVREGLARGDADADADADAEWDWGNGRGAMATEKHTEEAH